MKKTYSDIQAAAPEDIDDRVFTALAPHVGKNNAISRRALIEAVFGRKITSGESIANSTQDRNIRDAIARLQERHAILSSSGCGGYYLPANWEEVTRFASEIVSRARKLERKARRLEQLAAADFGQQMRLL